MTKIHGVGVWPGAELTAPQAIDVAVQADNAGIHSVWFSEAYYARDAISVLAATAVKTSRIKLATGVVNPCTRHPALLAMTMATLNELAPGRVIYGLGSSERPWVENMGYDFSRPKTAVSEAIDVYESLLALHTVQFEGRETTLKDARMISARSSRPPTWCWPPSARGCRPSRGSAAGASCSRWAGPRWPGRWSGGWRRPTTISSSV
jgi:5,10-methylenetetrahydromethanopterin reductase